VITPPFKALRSSATLLPEKSGVLALARVDVRFLAAVRFGAALAALRFGAALAREVEADFARVVDAAFARVVDFARELEDLDAALALRVDPPLRPAGALRALGM
jgi:hypothetical protein